MIVKDVVRVSLRWLDAIVPVPLPHKYCYDRLRNTCASGVINGDFLAQCSRSLIMLFFYFKTNQHVIVVQLDKSMRDLAQNILKLMVMPIIAK